jgi:hypothetical protein
MTDDRRYHLRMKAPFAWYDHGGSQQFHQWATGDTVTDPAMITLLERLDAPVQKFYEGKHLR